MNDKEMTDYLTKDDALAGAWRVMGILAGVLQALVIYSLVRLRDSVDGNTDSVRKMETELGVLEQKIETIKEGQ